MDNVQNLALSSPAAAVSRSVWFSYGLKAPEFVFLLFSNAYGRSVALMSTQPITEISTRTLRTSTYIK
jgi:hypothetical protein